jgi:nitroreductase
MIGKYIFKKMLGITIVFIVSCILITPLVAMQVPFVKNNNEVSCILSQNYILPPPQDIDMPLEETIMRRMSVREFTEDVVSDEDLSTILWAAYGKRIDEEFTVPEYNNAHSSVIYVLKEEGVYTYNPDGHELVFYKEGDYRDTVGWQWKAPIQLGLCWNTDIADKNMGSAELGAVGQNIYFSANAIGLGTVITAQHPTPAIKPVGLPENHQGMAVMPLGHPIYDYNFVNRPMLISLLPRIKISDMGLTTALETRDQVTSWDADSISRQDLSHLIWVSYGYSYYIDESGSANVIKRHHTLPSAHGYYPFRIYSMTKSGISRYNYGLYNIDKWGLPVFSFLFPIAFGDNRVSLAEASEDFLSEAPLSIIIVLDIENTNKWDDLSADNVRWIWYYEAGASAHNVLLQATSRGLAGNIVHVQDKDAVCSLLNLDNEKFDPMFIVPVG